MIEVNALICAHEVVPKAQIPRRGWAKKTELRISEDGWVPEVAYFLRWESACDGRPIMA